MATAEARGKLAELYARHAPDAVRLAYLLTGNAALAEDIAQEAFVRVVTRFHDLRSPDSFHWYLRRTVVNLTNSSFRRAKLERTVLARRAAAPPGPSPQDAVEERHEMWARLQRLPDRQRAAIVLRFYEDLTEAQTAEVLRCPVGTVKSWVSRGLATLRGELAQR